MVTSTYLCDHTADNMTDLLIHIGYHKTATTWLQTQFFDKPALGFGRIRTPAGPAPITEPHPLAFEAERCRAHFAPAIAQAHAAGLTPVLSHERLSGAIHSGALDSKEIADRLHAAFPQAHSLIVIREQRAMLRATYGQYVKVGGVWSLHRYLQPPRAHSRSAKYATFRLAHLQYDLLIAHYQQLFGAANVTVLPYELFLRAPLDFLGRIMAAAGRPTDPTHLATLPVSTPVNPSLSAAGIAVLRVLNRALGPRTPLNPTPLLPLVRTGRRTGDQVRRLDPLLPAAWKAAAERHMAQQIAAAAGQYGASNRRTAALIGCDLAQFGYDCAEELATNDTNDTN